MSRKHKPVTKTGERSTRAAGFWLAVLAYLLLHFVTRTLSPLIFLLAYILIPVVVGFVAARGTQQIDTTGRRFRSGFWACSRPAALYTAYHLMMAHSGVGEVASAGTVFLIGLFVMVAYALLAGSVAGLAGIVVFHRSDRVGGNA